MKRLHKGAILAATALVAWTCRGDPTASLRSGPKSLSVNPGVMFIDSGDARGIEVRALDDQLNAVAVPISATSSNTAVVTVAFDSGQVSPDAARNTFVVTAVAPGQATVNLSGGGLTDAATIIVLLPELPLAISNTAPKAGQAITVRATPTHKFTDTTEVFFGGDVPGLLHLLTPDSLIVVAPFGSSPGVLTINSINVLYRAGLVQNLTTTTRVVVTGDIWPATDSSYATAPDLFSVLALPAVGDSVHTITNFNTGLDNNPQCGEAYDPTSGSSGPCVVYKFTVPGPDSLNLLFRFDWDNDADIDAYACSAPNADGSSCDFESGGSAASGRQPEYLRNLLVSGVRTPTPFKYAPGTHYLVLELYGGDKPSNMYVTVYRK